MTVVRNLFQQLILVCCGVAIPVSAANSYVVKPDTSAWDQLTGTMSYRSIGPFRGGRSAACVGVKAKPNEFLFGATGGGVWKTSDGGSSWFNISDGFFGGSIGAVAIADSDPNVIYVGGGEKTVRGNVSHGDGMWKSMDGGKTWSFIGLEDSQFIPRIRIHPQNPDVVYVAALGHLFGPNQQRGVFRSKDGGKTWERVLFVNDEAGAVDLIIDPNNPRILYATIWQVKRTPYSLESGGPASGIWKSVDSGDTWTEITRNSGLPSGLVGIIGVAVSPVNSDRVWAQVEAEDGGLFRSDDAGQTWRRVNQDRNLRQRAWYYTRVYAGPQDIDEVYVLNVQFWRSLDGGSTFKSISTPHGDHHDLWIDPNDPDRMIIADDGGAQVSFNRGETFSTYMNQPTSQFYRVTTDNHFPYRIYGAQQDNSTVRIFHRSDAFSITEQDWEPTAGGESGHLAPHPTDPDIVYGGSYGGYLTMLNHRTKAIRNVHVWPDNPMGHGAGTLRYRFQWNFPIHFSPHNPERLYAAANVLFVTEDGGESWQQLSPDLTRNDQSKLGPSGGPITKDNTSVEYYCTIFAFAESSHEEGVLWVGSDDGLIHISRDAGASWENVTPSEMPEWAQVNSIEVHPFEPGGLYVAATRYKLDDFRPYLFKTVDYGKTWTRINEGIDRQHFTRVVRADPVRRGLLFAGTERGMYISLNDGHVWRPFQLDLPIVPITDLAIKENDLIVATQGRSFYVLDDLTPLHQWDEHALSNQAATILQPRPTYRMRGGGSGKATLTAGANPPAGVTFRIYLKENPTQPMQLVIIDEQGGVPTTFSTDAKRDKGETAMTLKAGFNTVYWDMSYPRADTFDGMVLWGGGTNGPRAVPGTYRAILSPVSTQVNTLDANETDASPAADQVSHSIEFEIRIDPRATASIDDLQKQFDLLIEIRDKLSETHRAIKKIRDIKQQISGLHQRIKDNSLYKDIVDQGNAILTQLTHIEEELYQTRMQSSQDPLNFPIRLNNRLSGLVGVVAAGDNRPTVQSYEVRDEIVKLIDVELEKLEQIIGHDLRALNDAYRDAAGPIIFVDE
ncbi:MAG TPA: hypothetical protein PKD64_07820 [Pirellulaceae bacterium]|nr:hypothetical protein [Pirellulaceae bacterium]HMO92095.1 hypothetical protein [Pirellulaceae bacterium]HMP69317.1 hypothetical protein [Pirellulaceae bacterium]